MEFSSNYSINKKLRIDKNITRKKRVDKNSKPSGCSTHLQRIYHTCKCKDCMKKRKNLKVTIKRQNLTEKQMIRETEIMKNEIIETFKTNNSFPKSLHQLDTLNPDEWMMFLPVIKMWLTDKNTLPDENTTFDEIKKLVIDSHYKAKSKLSNYNNLYNYDKNEFLKFISSKYNNIKIIS